LCLREASICTESIIVLAACTHLTSLKILDLFGNPIGKYGCRVLAHCKHFPNLECLSVYGPNIELEGCMEIATSCCFPNLKELSLGLYSVGEDIFDGSEVVTAVASNPHFKLTLFDSKFNSVSPQAIETLINKCHISELSMNQTIIGSDGAIAITNCPNATYLTSLSLRDSTVGEDGIKALAECPHLVNLTLLDLSENEGLKEETVKMILQSPHLRNVTDLSLAGMLNTSWVNDFYCHATKLKKLKDFLY